MEFCRPLLTFELRRLVPSACVLTSDLQTKYPPVTFPQLGLKADVCKERRALKG